MTTLRYQPIAGKAAEIVDDILHTREVTEAFSNTFTIHLVCEEIVVNVVSYAYPEGEDGWLQVEVENDGDDLTLRFTDGGLPFNPLEHEDPDTTLPLEARQIGGLGIFLTKQMMDHVEYQRTDNENRLTVRKHTGSGD